MNYMRQSQILKASINTNTITYSQHDCKQRNFYLLSKTTEKVERNGDDR